MSAVLEQLKSQLKALGGFHEREYLHSSLYGDSASIPKGAITQVIGPGKTECVVEFLSHSPRLKIAWIEKDLSIFPSALLQRNLSLPRILFAEAGEQYIWACLQILNSALFDVVVLSLPFQKILPLQDLRVVRRLQLVTERSKCSLIFLTDQTLSAWPISLSLQSVVQGTQLTWTKIKREAASE